MKISLKCQKNIISVEAKKLMDQSQVMVFSLNFVNLRKICWKNYALKVKKTEQCHPHTNNFIYLIRKLEYLHVVKIVYLLIGNRIMWGI